MLAHTRLDPPQISLIVIVKKLLVSRCVLPEDSKVIGKNMSFFFSHTSVYFLFLLCTATFAALPSFLASVTEIVLLQLGPGQGCTIETSVASLSTLPTSST